MAQPPDGQSCETCAYFIKETCRRKLPEVIAPTIFGWVPCRPDDWCFNWKGGAPPPQPAPPA